MDFTLVCMNTTILVGLLAWRLLLLVYWGA